MLRNFLPEDCVGLEFRKQRFSTNARIGRAEYVRRFSGGIIWIYVQTIVILGRGLGTVFDVAVEHWGPGWLELFRVNGLVKSGGRTGTFFQLHQVQLGLDGHGHTTLIGNVQIKPKPSLVQHGLGRLVNHRRALANHELRDRQTLHEIWQFDVGQLSLDFILNEVYKVRTLVHIEQYSTQQSIHPDNVSKVRRRFPFRSCV